MRKRQMHVPAIKDQNGQHLFNHHSLINKQQRKLIPIKFLVSLQIETGLALVLGNSLAVKFHSLQRFLVFTQAFFFSAHLLTLIDYVSM